MQIKSTNLISRCYICGGIIQPYSRTPIDGHSEVFLTKELYNILPELIYVRCQSCDSLLAGDTRCNPALLERIYSELPKDYWEKLGDCNSFYTLIEKYIKKYASGKILYDVGCGDGKLLSRLSEQWDKHGIEPGQKAVEKCHDLGLNVILGTPISIKANSVCDVVTCIDVIEHMLDPVSEIKSMYQMLKPDGIILLFTGNPECLTARLAGAQWVYLHYVGHVSILSKRALRVILEQTGFDVVFSNTVNHPSHLTVGTWFCCLLYNIFLKIIGRLPIRLGYCLDHQMVLARKKHI